MSIITDKNGRLAQLTPYGHYLVGIGLGIAIGAMSVSSDKFPTAQFIVAAVALIAGVVISIVKKK